MSSRGGRPRGNRGGRGVGRVTANNSTTTESEDRADHADSTRGGADAGRGFVDRGDHRGRPPNQSRPTSHGSIRGPGARGTSGSPQKRFGDDEHTSGDRIFR